MLSLLKKKTGIDNCYNSQPPEFISKTVGGEAFNLLDFAGRVIILRFTSFNIKDIPNLVYLDDLAEKWESFGAVLFFIDFFGRYHNRAQNTMIGLKSRIVENVDSARSFFRASPEETIIIGKDYRIKFKYQTYDKTILYDEIHKWIFHERNEHCDSSYESIDRVINKIAYFDLLNNKSTLQKEKGKKVFLTLFSSICTACPDQERLEVIESITEERRDVTCIILLGKKNLPIRISDNASMMALQAKGIHVGLVDGNSVSLKEYYQLFELDVDPKSIIIDSAGRIAHVETRNTTNLFHRKEYVQNLLK